MKEKIALLSAIANFVLATGKIAVGIFSNSAAVLAEGLHSSMDIFSSVIGYLGIKAAGKPEDEKHPYGHYKFEVLAGVIITLILLATGLGIVWEAYQDFRNPERIEISYLAFGIMIFSALVNEIMARLKIYTGKKENSIALLSDGIHSRVDVFTSLAVFAGLFLTRYWIYMDPLLALLVGLYIIKESFSLGKEAIDSLLDVSAGPEIEEEIRRIAEGRNIEINSLKTQKKGSAVTADMEIKLPRDLSVEEATKASDSLREKLTGEIENLRYVVIQITSHEVQTGFYKTGFGRGLGWHRHGRFRNEVEVAQGEGPGGNCICPRCGYTISHERSVPCSTLKCPSCDINLTRGQ